MNHKRGKPHTLLTVFQRLSPFDFDMGKVFKGRSFQTLFNNPTCAHKYTDLIRDWKQIIYLDSSVDKIPFFDFVNSLSVCLGLWWHHQKESVSHQLVIILSKYPAMREGMSSPNKLPRKWNKLTWYLGCVVVQGLRIITTSSIWSTAYNRVWSTRYASVVYVQSTAINVPKLW